jgi:hypothetical protein
MNSRGWLLAWCMTAPGCADLEETAAAGSGEATGARCRGDDCPAATASCRGSCLGILMESAEDRLEFKPDGSAHIGAWSATDARIELSDIPTIGAIEGRKALCAGLADGPGRWFLDFLDEQGTSNILENLHEPRREVLRFAITGSPDVTVGMGWSEHAGMCVPVLNHTARPITSGSWTQVAIPLSTFPGIDLTQTRTLVEMSARAQRGGLVHFCVDAVRIDEATDEESNEQVEPPDGAFPPFEPPLDLFLDQGCLGSEAPDDVIFGLLFEQDQDLQFDCDGGAHIGAWGGEAITLSDGCGARDHVEGSSGLCAEVSDPPAGWWLELRADQSDPESQVPADFEDYLGGYLQFELTTDTEVWVKIEDAANRGKPESELNTADFVTDSAVARGWQTVSIPLCRFAERDFSALYSPVGMFVPSDAAPGRFCVDAVRYVKPAQCPNLCE